MKAGFYLELIQTIFQAVDEEGKLRNRVVAFTSATPGEGVSYVVDLIAKELATQTQRRVLRMDAAAFSQLDLSDPQVVAKHCEETEIENLLTLAGKGASEGALVGVATNGPSSVITAGRGEWDSLPEYRAECMKALRWNFDYVVIDCGSFATSSEATALAPFVDGISIVVKAGETRRGQIQRAHQLVESAGAAFLGFVLNQRRYPMPGWLYRRL